MGISTAIQKILKTLRRWWRLFAALAVVTLLIATHRFASHLGRGAALWETLPAAELEALEFSLGEVREEQSDPDAYYRRFPAKYREALARLSAGIESELTSHSGSPEEVAAMRNLLDAAGKAEERLGSP